MSHTRFLKWVAYMELKEESRSKLDHYLASLRHDLHLLIQLVRNAFGDASARAPDVDKMFLTGKSAEQADPDEFAVPKGYHYDPHDPVKGDYHKGYGLPGIELGQPLPEKWQKVNDQEKRKWEAFAKMGLVQAVRPGVRSDV